MEGMFRDVYDKLFNKYQIKQKPKQQKTTVVTQTTTVAPVPTGKQKYDGSTLSVSANIWPFLREWEG